MFNKSVLICYSMAEVHAKWGFGGCSAQHPIFLGAVEAKICPFLIAVTHLATLLLSNRSKPVAFCTFGMYDGTNFCQPRSTSMVHSGRRSYTRYLRQAPLGLKGVPAIHNAIHAANMHTENSICRIANISIYTCSIRYTHTHYSRQKADYMYDVFPSTQYLGYQGIVLAQTSSEQGSGVKLSMVVVRRRFGTSTPDTIHRYLKTLLNRFEMPAVATI